MARAHHLLGTVLLSPVLAFMLVAKMIPEALKLGILHQHWTRYISRNSTYCSYRWPCVCPASPSNYLAAAESSSRQQQQLVAVEISSTLQQPKATAESSRKQQKVAESSRK